MSLGWMSIAVFAAAISLAGCASGPASPSSGSQSSNGARCLSDRDREPGQRSIIYFLCIQSP